MILTTLTAFLYAPAIQYKRGGLYAPLKALALITALIDVLANYTELALIFGWPREGEYTITRRIRRMHFDEVAARRELARLVQVYLDAAEPDGKH